LASVCLAVTGIGVAHAAMPAPYNPSAVPHQVRVPQLPEGAELHADFDRSPWDRAALLTGNLDWRRIRTADLPVRTYLYYDSKALYVGYRCDVHGRDTLKAEVRERDQDLKKDDHFTLELDVGPTGRVFYRFVVNSLGTLADSVIIDKSWNSTAQIKTQTDEKGWSAAMRIPFSDFQRGTPELNSFWTFNLSTRSGYDNCWAPVFGGYHTPEQFARLVFGGEQTQAARMIEFKPLRPGDNALRVQVPAGTRYRLEAVDLSDRVSWRHDGDAGGDGRIAFSLTDDRVRFFNFTFKDAADRELLAFWRPAEIPTLTSRLPALADKCSLLRQQLDSFSQEYKPQVATMLAEVDALLGTPADSLYADWAKLHDKLNSLDRRVTDAWLYAQTLKRLSSRASFAVALASPMDNVMIQDFPCPGVSGESYPLSLARNEHEAVQVVVIPMTGALKNVAVNASPALGTRDQQPLAGKVAVSLVGHVKTRPAGSYLPDYVGWYPDPILDFQQNCDIAAGEHVAFWVDVAADKNARPGDYESTISICAEGGEPLKVRLGIHVWDIELRDGTHLRTAFTYNEVSTKHLYKGRWSAEMARKYYDFLLDHRLNIDSLYGKDVRDVEVLKYGASRGMNAFNLFFVGRGANADVVRKLLEERVPAIKAAGLYPLAYLYGFDEVNDEVFPRIKEVFGAARQLYPDLPRMTTGYDNTFGRTTGLRDYIDIWVPLIPEYNMAEAERLRAEGKDMWWYLCVGPRHPYPNWFVDSPAIEGRLLMGAMSYKYRVGGVLYFMMNGWSLIEQPISKGPYTDWFPGSGKSREGTYANGDGSIFCAGPDGPVTTIRFENIRDGLEDYEYLFTLADVVKQVAAKPANLQRTQFIQEARDLLSVPDDVVESSSRYTNEPRRVYDLRQKVATMILRGRTLTQ
jgi:hypothetical protein